MLQIQKSRTLSTYKKILCFQANVWEHLQFIKRVQLTNKCYVVNFNLSMLMLFFGKPHNYTRNAFIKCFVPNFFSQQNISLW